MTPVLRKFLLAAVAISVWALASAGEDPGQHPSIQLFLKACQITYGHPAQVASAATQFGFAELEGARASPYLLGRTGRVWGGNIASKVYAVAVQPDGLCTVFIHEGDPTLIQTALESWLPPVQSGVVVKKQALESPQGLNTTSYELSGARVRERWVLTVASDPASRIRAILSWSPIS